MQLQNCSILIALILLGLFYSSGKDINAQSKMRIGVFDSRAVAIVYYQSQSSNTQQIFSSLKTQMVEAKEKDDQEKIASLEREGMLRQTMMHQQGFGTGSVKDIMETVKDKMAQLAKDENLSAIVSKWELVFNGTDVEILDITEKIVHFFEPNEKMKQMIPEIMNTEPIKDAYLIQD